MVVPTAVAHKAVMKSELLLGSLSANSLIPYVLAMATPIFAITQAEHK